MSRWLRWLVAGPLFAAAAVLAVWGLLHRGDAGAAVTPAGVPILTVVGVRMLWRLGE